MLRHINRSSLIFSSVEYSGDTNVEENALCTKVHCNKMWRFKNHNDLLLGQLGLTWLGSTLTSIFHDLKVVSVIIRYLCLPFESNFIMGLEEESADLCKFHSTALLLCAL